MLVENNQIIFDKYTIRGNQNWEEMMTKNPRSFNAYQQARYEWILRLVGEIKQKKVLDLGSGGGSLTYLLAKSGAEVIGAEYDELGIKYARENLQNVSKDKNLNYQFVQASAYNLPFPDDFFDVVVSCEVIEHLAEPEKMLKEMKRVLRSGGKFVLTTPYRLTEFPQDHNHVREYFPEELRVLLEKYFKAVEIKLTHHIFWRALYTYRFNFFGRRPAGRWIINILTLWFKRNPFMIDYQKLGKFDLFSTICTFGRK